jgi:lycopene cyclase domain-containing protein
MTYLAITLPAMLLAIILGLIFGKKLGAKALLTTLVVMLVLTAIFDNLIIGASLVAYDPWQINGFKIGLAPIEDFAYTVFGVVAIPLLWMLLGRKK